MPGISIVKQLTHPHNPEIDTSFLRSKNGMNMDIDRYHNREDPRDEANLSQVLAWRNPLGLDQGLACICRTWRTSLEQGFGVECFGKVDRA